MEEKHGRRRKQEKRHQYCFDSSGAILYLRALQSRSGRSLIDPTLQDNVLTPNNFFQYIYHIGYAINVHSIENSGLIPGGQNSSRDRQTYSLQLGTNLCNLNIGLMKSGRASWQDEEETRTYFSIVLIHQEQFCTSELSKVIQDAILLILHYRTMS